TQLHICCEHFICEPSMSRESCNISARPNAAPIPIIRNLSAFSRVGIRNDEVSSTLIDFAERLAKSRDVSCGEAFRLVFSKYPSLGNRVRGVEVDEVSSLCVTNCFFKITVKESGLL